MRRFILLFLILSASPCCAETPKLFREKPFTCAVLAEAVNHYVALGENAAIKELEDLTLDWEKEDTAGEFSKNVRVGWVCRILFQPKEAKPLRQPSFGDLWLPHRSMPLKTWPLYPVVSSGKSYFVLSEGYLLGGVPENQKPISSTAGPTESSAQSEFQSPLETRRSKTWKNSATQMLGRPLSGPTVAQVSPIRLVKSGLGASSRVRQ